MRSDRSAAPRLLRAVMFAALTVVVGALGHALSSDGTMPQWQVMAPVAAMLGLAAWAFLGRRRAWWSIGAAVVAAQALVHAVALGASAHAGAAGCTPRIDALGACESTWAVVAAHATIVVLGVVAVLGIDRLTRRVVRSIVAHVLGAWFATRVEGVEPSQRAELTVAMPISTWFSDARGMRGPPVAGTS